MPNDYAALQARIADELARSNLTTQIQREILSAVRHYQRQRFWFNEEVADATTEAGSSGLTLEVPTDAIDFDELTVTVNGIPRQMERLQWRDFVARGALNANNQGVPACWSYKDDVFWLSPTPDAAYAITLYYLGSVAELSASTDSNVWTDTAEELIRARAKAAVLINYVKSPAAIQEATALAQADQPYLSSIEKIAYIALKNQTSRRRAARRLHTEIASAAGYNIVTDS